MKSFIFATLIVLSSNLAFALRVSPTPVPTPFPTPTATPGVAPDPSATPEPPLQPIQETIAPTGSFPTDEYWKVAVVQWNPPQSAPLATLGAPQTQIDAYKTSVLALMDAKIQEAVKADAKYIAFSEFANVGYPDIPNVPPDQDNYRNRTDIAPYVETIPGPTTNHFGSLAKQYGVWIQFGMAEVDSATNLYYDDAVVIDDQGNVIAKYRKHHLFEIETNFLAVGQGIATFDTPAGKWGLIVCSDIYFDPVLDAYAALHLDVVGLSTSWDEQNTGMGYFQAAATRMSTYLLAANQDYFPDTGVINPDGTLQSHIRQSLDTIAYGYIPLK
jgi:predicted amidohydrolase